MAGVSGHVTPGSKMGTRARALDTASSTSRLLLGCVQYAGDITTNTAAARGIAVEALALRSPLHKTPS
jgi:hypothetical protein